MTENEFLKEKQSVLKTMQDTVCLTKEEAEIMAVALEELLQYRAIGTVEECRSAVKRMRLRKPLKIDAGYRFTDTYRCPECRKDFSGTGIADYCYHCGQALDWSE